MLHLAGSDPESQTSKRAVRAGMTVAANHRHARQGCALLRADDMHDALAPISDIKISQLMGARIMVECLDLQPRDLIRNASDAR